MKAIRIEYMKEKGISRDADVPDLKDKFYREYIAWLEDKTVFVKNVKPVEESNIVWDGEPIENLSKEELIKAVEHLFKEMVEYRDKYFDWQKKNPIDYIMRNK